MNANLINSNSKKGGLLKSTMESTVEKKEEDEDFNDILNEVIFFFQKF